MTFQPSNDVGYAPMPTPLMPTNPMPTTTVVTTAPIVTAPSGRLGPPSPGLIVVFVGWAALAGVMLLLGGMVFVGLLQAAAGG